MSSHPFDRLAESLARGLSRRTFLRLISHLAAGVAAYKLLPTQPIALARTREQQDANAPQPPGYWPPEAEFPLHWLRGGLENNAQLTVLALAAENGDGGGSWCEIAEAIVNSAFPHITGLVEIATPFGEDCGTTDCLQCCYVPGTNSCHSSYIGEDVINCSPKVYGEGTRGVGLTLLLQEPPPEGTCLFTPQVCTHVGMCLQETAEATSMHRTMQADPSNYLADPRAIKQRARVFAMYGLTQARRYLDEYATDSLDALPLQSLEDAVFGRGWATWRQDMTALTFDLNDPLFRVTDGAGNLIEREARANVWRVFALLRLLTGLPNLAARLEYVESRVWNASDKASYLASTPNPDAALEESLDPHMVGILKRIPSLQDYQLFAVPLAGEPDSSGRYGGMTLGQPPTLRLSAAVVGLTATLTATLDDPTHGVDGLARPLAVDWGDGRVTRHEFAAGQATLTVAHDYAAASRYAIYAVAANNSGLRGAVCVVVEPAGIAEIAQTVPAPFTLVRAGLTRLTVLNLPFTEDLHLALLFTNASDLQFLAGRSRIASGPTNITVPVDLGAAYAHNPSRLEIATLSIEPRHGLTAPSGGRIPALTLSSLALGVFSTAQMSTVDQVLNLDIGMLDVYVAGEATPLPGTVLTVNSDGSITAPLLYRATSTAPWQRIERIAIALTPELLDGFVLDAAPTALPVGTNVAWSERRPGAFMRIHDEPPPEPPPPTAPDEYRLYLPGIQK
jgi:hypothetical protein